MSRDEFRFVFVEPIGELMRALAVGGMLAAFAGVGLGAVYGVGVLVAMPTGWSSGDTFLVMLWVACGAAGLTAAVAAVIARRREYRQRRRVRE